MPFVFLDTETSGLDPYIHDITEIGCVLIDDNYKIKEKQIFHERLKLQNPDKADDVALEIGHYSEALWEKTGSEASVGLNKWNDWLKTVDSARPTIVAQNAEFDKSMIQSNCDRFHIYPYVNNAWLDLIAYWIMYKHKTGNMHLGNSQSVIAGHFKIVNPKAHAALTDAFTGAICFSEIMKVVAINA